MFGCGLDGLRILYSEWISPEILKNLGTIVRDFVSDKFYDHKTLKLKNSEGLLNIPLSEAVIYDSGIEVNIFTLISIFTNGKAVSLSVFKLQSRNYEALVSNQCFSLCVFPKFTNTNRRISRSNVS
jgi:hypothetical protein